MKVLSIGGSNNTVSINRKLANYAASLIPNSQVEVYDISTIDLPIYSQNLEEANGIHQTAQDFANKIDQTDMIVISLAEHNGSYSAAFKNLFDWTSRIQGRKTWGEKPMLLMATSPGARGGAGVLQGAQMSFPYLGATVKATYSLPSFYENFNDETGITDADLKSKLLEIIKSL